MTPLRAFHHLVAHVLITGVMGMFLWFALIFWIYLETGSVLATSVLGGGYSLLSAALGMYFGSFVDRHRKRSAMTLAGVVATVTFALAAAVYVMGGRNDLADTGRAGFWIIAVLVLIGAVMANLRSIALSTTVTLLVPEDRRDKANGLIGTSTGIMFTVTSILGGFVVGRGGMGWSIAVGLVFTAVSMLQLLVIRFTEDVPTPTEPAASRADLAGALATIRRIPGLGGMIAFAAFNNLVGGVFMALMDAYGLSLMSVEAWGVLFAVTSVGFIIGGAIIAKTGLGTRPMRLILLGNLGSWAICCLFTLRSSVWMLGVGMLVWLTLMPMIEAAEQTVLQRVVPFEYQGRVFGFGQTVENAAAPLTAFVIGPIAQFAAIPYMTTGGGVDSIGGWFGVGRERGLALIFTLAGVVGVVATIASRSSRWYRLLTAADAAHATSDGIGEGVGVPISAAAREMPEAVV